MWHHNILQPVRLFSMNIPRQIQYYIIIANIIIERYYNYNINVMWSLTFIRSLYPNLSRKHNKRQSSRLKARIDQIWTWELYWKT